MSKVNAKEKKHLDAQSCIHASLVHSYWRAAANDEAVWHSFLQEDWCQDAAVGPDGSSAATYRAAYGKWAAALTDPVLSHEVIRPAVQAWTRIKSWLSGHLPEAAASLRPGIPHARLQELQATLPFPLPQELAAIYRVHDGQELLWDTFFDWKHNIPDAEGKHQALLAQAKHAAAAKKPGQGTKPTKPPTDGSSEEGSSDVEDDEGDEEADDDDALMRRTIFHGMFGGYIFYDHVVCSRLLPLERAVWWTDFLRSQNAMPEGFPGLIIAASFNFKKFHVVNLEDGSVHVRHGRPAMLPAAPPPDQGLPAASTKVGLWFAEYARRLHDGWYNVELLDEDFKESKAISLYPAKGPDAAVETTRGVRVSATSLFAPEVSVTGRSVISYCVKFQLLSEEEQLEIIEAAKRSSASSSLTAGSAPVLGGNDLSKAHVLQSCQLMTRHWIIRDQHGHQADEVKGEGVIGKYPILVPGGEVFTYQSCTHQHEQLGYMEGFFRFVEGTIRNKTGPEWDVVCPRFPLRVPEFIY